MHRSVCVSEVILAPARQLPLLVVVAGAVVEVDDGAVGSALVGVQVDCGLRSAGE